MNERFKKELLVMVPFPGAVLCRKMSFKCLGGRVPNLGAGVTFPSQLPMRCMG